MAKYASVLFKSLFATLKFISTYKREKYQQLAAKPDDGSSFLPWSSSSPPKALFLKQCLFSKSGKIIYVTFNFEKRLLFVVCGVEASYPIFRVLWWIFINGLVCCVTEKKLTLFAKSNRQLRNFSNYSWNKNKNSWHGLLPKIHYY